PCLHPFPTRRSSDLMPRRARRAFSRHACTGLLADYPTCSTLIDMAEKPRYQALASIDPRELAKFQAGIRKRYTDEQIVAEIVASAERLGRSPTMREFAADAETAVQ